MTDFKTRTLEVISLWAHDEFCETHGDALCAADKYRDEFYTVIIEEY